MSGPKVVRVVTREEQEAAARQQVLRVDAALQELQRCAQRHGVLDEALAARIDVRRERIAQLFREGRWAALQKEGPAEVGFLRAEQERIRTEAVRRTEAARSRDLRTEAAARTLLAAFGAAGREPPAGLLDAARAARGADAATLTQMERSLAEAFRQLAPVPRAGATAAQRELAARLGAGEEGQRFSEWLAAQRQGPGGEVDSRLEALLAEVQALEDAAVVRPFLERADTISRETQAGRRALLTDALVLEVAAHRRAQREREAAAVRLREARADLMALDTLVPRTLAASIEVALDAGNLDGTEGLLKEVQGVLEAERQSLAAAARRRAVLEGLAALGYEVRETMAVAWAQEGRLVVRKPGAPDYGVELGAPADMARLQVRLVGAAHPQTPRDARRDRDMETVWCGEFQQLRGNLEALGTDVTIERALAVGVQPVKTSALEMPKTAEAADTIVSQDHRTAR